APRRREHFFPPESKTPASLYGLFVHAAEVILSDLKARIMGSEYLFYTTGSWRREVRLCGVKLVGLHEPRQVAWNTRDMHRQLAERHRFRMRPPLQLVSRNTFEDPPRDGSLLVKFIQQWISHVFTPLMARRKVDLRLSVRQTFRFAVPGMKTDLNYLGALGRLRLADRLVEPDLISERVHHGKGAITPPLVS